MSPRDPLPDLIELAAGPMLTPEQRRRLKPPCGTGKRGHVAPPGTGPENETCGSCRHLFRNELAKTYLKCELNRARWTGGLKTDVRARDRACSRWERAESGGYRDSPGGSATPPTGICRAPESTQTPEKAKTAAWRGF